MMASGWPGRQHVGGPARARPPRFPVDQPGQCVLQLQATASPAGGKVLNGISCTTASSCTAVGWYRHSLYQPLAEQR